MVLRTLSGWPAGALLALVAPSLSAQMHHVDRPGKVTRAVGVYEWTGDLAKPDAARFVPVSLYIDGRFEDAGLYLARPVPFALQTGDLYTVQQAGEPEGQLALENAAHVVTGNAIADDNPAGAWYGYGRYTAEAPPPPAPSLHKTAHPGAITVTSASGKAEPAPAGKSDAADNKPHMSRRGEADPSLDPASAPSRTDGDATSKPAADTASGNGNSQPAPSHGRSSEDEDTDRPTLARRNPAQDAERRKNAGGPKSTSGVTAAGPAPGDDPDRPVLTHNTAAERETEPLTGMPVGMHQAVAVSDASVHDPHPFARSWDTPGERAGALLALEAMVRPRLTAYLSENRLEPSARALPPPGVTPGVTASDHEGIAANTDAGAGAPPRLERGRPREYSGAAPQPVPASTGAAAPPATASSARTARSTTTPHRRTTGSASATLSLQNESLSAYTLSYGGLPTFVYTAAVPVSVSVRPAAGSPSAPASFTGAPASAEQPIAFVTVVAQRLPSGELQPALLSITDNRHLDRAPRLRPVDVVDADGSHRGSLLFELQAGSSRQFALYRLISARAENTFTTAALE